MLDLQGDRPGPIGPYETNLENAKKVRDEWQIGKADPGATRSLLETIRQASPEEASAEAVKLLNDGVAPGSLWDAVLLASSEMMMRNPGIISLHATTAANALHFMFHASGDDTSRKLALLQAVGWQPLYRARNKSPKPIVIDDLGEDAPISTNEEAVGEIFEANGDDHGRAAAKAMGFLAKGGSPKVLFDAAARMIFHKGTNSHDYKYGAAIWEECLAATNPKWRPNLAAAAMFNLPGAGKADSPLMIRARDAVANVMG